MNGRRRIEIHHIIEKLGDLRPEIQGVLDDEQQSLDNMPENLVGSEKYISMESAINNLEDVDTYIDEIIEYLNEAMES